MATAIDLTTGEVMDGAAAAMNDNAKSIYPYSVQVPYLNMALRALQEEFELNEMPVTGTTSSVITVPFGTSSLGYGGVSPKLPDDLIEPIELWERATNTNPFVPMTKINILPEYMNGSAIPQFIYFTWETNQIKFFAATQTNDIKMNYLRYLFPKIAVNDDGLTALGVANAGSYLIFKTAAFIARYIAENTSRAQQLEGDSADALFKSLGITSKNRQSIIVRHRPFRSGYKSRALY